MAITNEQMNIYLGVDATVASRELDKISSELTKTNSSMEQLQNTSKDLNKDLTGLGYAGAALQGSMLGGGLQTESLTAATRDLAAAYQEAIGKTAELLSKEKGRAEALKVAMEVAKVAAISTGVALGALGGLNLFRNVQKDAEILTSTFTAVGSSVGTMANGFKQASSNGEAFSKTAAGISGVAKTIGVFALGVGATLKNTFADTLKDVPTIFNGIGNFLKHAVMNWKTTLIEFTSYAPIIAGAFGIVEESLGNADSTFGELAREVSNFSGVATIAFTIAMHKIASVFSDTITSMGLSLMGFVKDFESHWAEAEKSTKSFTFTMKGFQNTFGESMIGTADQWESLIADIAERSNYSINEIQKSSQLIIAENTAIGLSFETNSEFIKRAAEIASNKGMDLQDVVMRLQSGILGSSQAVGVLGINIGTHALEHSELNKELKKTIGTMTELEKQEIRLAEIMRQSSPIVGSLADQSTNYEAVNKKLSIAIDQLKIKLGTINFLIVGAKSIWAEFVKSLSNMPRIFFEISGALIEISGIFLTLMGYFIGGIFTITSLSVAYGFLNKQMATNLKLQSMMNIAFASSPIKSQIVDVKTLGDVFKNIVIIFKSLVTLVSGEFLKVLFGWAGKLGAVMYKIVKNPLFAKASLIAVGVIAVAKALQEMNHEFDFLNRLIAEFNPVLKDTSGIMNTLAVTASSSWTILINLIKIAVISLAELFNMIRLTASTFGRVFATDESNESVKKIMLIQDQFDGMFEAHDRYVSNIKESLLKLFEKFYFSDVAMGAEDANDKLKKMKKTLEDVAFRKEQINKALGEIDLNAIEVNIMGSEVEKLQLAFELSAKEIKKFSDEMEAADEVTQQSLDSFKKANESKYESLVKITKFQKDSYAEIEKIANEAKKSSDKRQDDETQNIISEFSDRRKAVEELEKSLSKLGPIAGKNAQIIINAYSQISASEKEALAAAKKRREEEGSREYEKVLKEQSEALQEILDKNIEIEKFVKGEGTTGRSRISSDLQIELDALERRLLLEKASWGVNSDIYKSLEKQIELRKQEAQIKIDKAPSAEYENIAKVGTNIGEKITKSFTDGFSGMVAGSASVVASMGTAISGIVEAINSLLDFIPNLLNSVAGIFNKITDFPKVLYEAFQGLFDSLVKMVSDFIPNLVDSIYKSFTQLKDFANNLANALNTLVDSLPDIISSLMERLPDIAVSLVENLSKAWLKIMNAIMIKLPIALVKGFLMGLQKIFEGVKRLLAGKSFLPKIKIDDNAIKKTYKNLAGTAGRLFSVKDLAESVKDPLDEMTQGIEDAFKKGTDWIKQAWMWVYEKILLPIWEMITGAWTWVRDKILMPIWNALSAIVRGAFGFVQALWDALGQVVSAAWFFVQNLWDTLGTIVSTAFQFVADLWNGLSGIVSAAFGWIVDNVITPMTTIGEKIAAPIALAFQSILLFFDQWIIQPLKSIAESFTRIMSTMGEKVTAAFSSVFMFFQDLQKFITKAFEPVFQFFGNIGQSIVDGVKKAATGGGITIGGEVGKAAETVKSWFAAGGQVPLYAASGVMVPRGTDTVPAMLTPGEFVMSKRGVNTAGLGMLQGINSGQMPTAGNTYNIQFEINVEAKTTMDEGFIRQQLIPKMRENLKRASLDGEFVLSSKGVRA